MGAVYRLDVWRDLRRTLEELAEVAELDVEAELVADRELAADCQRWRAVREARARELSARLVVA